MWMVDEISDTLLLPSFKNLNDLLKTLSAFIAAGPFSQPHHSYAQDSSQMDLYLSHWRRCMPDSSAKLVANLPQ